MRKQLVLRLGALAVVLALLEMVACGGPADVATEPLRIPKYVLFLTADGFRANYMEWYFPTNLNILMAEGVRIKNAKNVFPTVTAPNMTSLVTGSYPRTTGIACNSQYVRELDKIVKSPRDNKAETIAETLHKAGWKTAG